MSNTNALAAVLTRRSIGDTLKIIRVSQDPTVSRQVDPRSFVSDRHGQIGNLYVSSVSELGYVWGTTADTIIKLGTRPVPTGTLLCLRKYQPIADLGEVVEIIELAERPARKMNMSPFYWKLSSKNGRLEVGLHDADQPVSAQSFVLCRGGP